MARKQRKPRPPLKLPADLVPDLDDWGSPAEERKRARRDEWLREHDLSEQFFFTWLPAHLEERRRLAGWPPRAPARRKGQLPEEVRSCSLTWRPMMFRQPAGHPANSTKYKKLRASFFRRQGRVGMCAICGGAVDMSISGRHRDGPTVDHIVASSANGDFWDLQNWQLAHRSCNSAKGRGPGIREEPVSPNA